MRGAPITPSFSVTILSSSSASQIARDIGVGPTLLNRWCRELALKAVLMALWQREKHDEPVVLHSDRGTQGGFNWSSQHL